MSKLREGDRAIDAMGQAGTVKQIEGDDAHILMDTQSPSSEPKIVPIASLTFVSTPTPPVPTSVLDRV